MIRKRARLLEVRYEDETIWLTQKRIAELFGVSVKPNCEHFKNILASNELSENSVRSTVRRGRAGGTKRWNRCRLGFVQQSCRHGPQ